MEEIAAQFGLSSRQIRRIVQQEFGVSPIELVQTRRLLLAKQLLTETTLPIIEVAFASGFVLMAYELAASRILAPTIGTSIYVWTSVIGVMIAALAFDAERATPSSVDHPLRVVHDVTARHGPEGTRRSSCRIYAHLTGLASAAART